MSNEIILQQERLLQFTNFSNEDAWNIASSLLDKVKNKDSKPIGIRIVYENVLILKYLMVGKRESLWLQRKEKTVLESGHCSLYTFLNVEANKKYEAWQEDESYAICGGGFPILENNKVRGAICVSGLPHTEDHQLIVDTLSEYLEVSI